MPNEPRWLSVDDLIRFNELAVAETSEPFFVRDHGLLESALAKPINHWHYGELDVVVLAVTLLLGIARNHPFGQGNKRTAFAAADAFLYLNGYDLVVPDRAELADMIVAAITGDMSEHQFISIFSESVQVL